MLFEKNICDILFNNMNILFLLLVVELIVIASLCVTSKQAIWNTIVR